MAGCSEELGWDLSRHEAIGAAEIAAVCRARGRPRHAGAGRPVRGHAGVTCATAEGCRVTTDHGRGASVAYHTNKRGDRSCRSRAQEAPPFRLATPAGCHEA